MNLEPTETQRLLEQALRALFDAEAPFDRVREIERSGEHDVALWNALAARGWLGVAVSESGGGGGGGLVELGIAVTCAARQAVIAPLLEVALSARVLEAAGEGALVRDVLAGEAIGVPALLEADDRFDRLDRVETRVDAAGRLTGEKRFVDYGQHATHHLVVAQESGAVGLFLVDTREGAVTSHPLAHIGRTPACLTRYDGVPARRIAGADAVDALVLHGRALAALQCVGAMERALEMTVEYAKVREQFGQPIARFQAVRHHCADMAIRVARARVMAFEALSALDAGDADPVRVAAAKAAASRAAPEVTLLAHQIHGGNGVIEENDLYFFTLRGKERSLAWGTVEECLDVMAEHVETPVDWL